MNHLPCDRPKSVMTGVADFANWIPKVKTMNRQCLALASALIVALLAGVSAVADNTKSYDLLFREGTLGDINKNEALIYQRVVSNKASAEMAKRDTGDIALSMNDPEGKLARLEFRSNDKKRGLGVFPVSVGNPMIMYFYETVIRDMAETAGGSPHYIRNRVKEALVRPADSEVGEAVFQGQTVKTQTVRIRPFEEDPNKARMRGFGALELKIVMSETVPGWYLNLSAEAGEGDTTVYRSEITFDRLEDAK